MEASTFLILSELMMNLRPTHYCLAGVVSLCLLAGCTGEDAEREQPRQEDAGADAAADTDHATDTAPPTDSDAVLDDTGTTDPQLIDMSALEYVGGFRVPAGEFGDSSMNFAQGPIYYDHENHSVFLVGHAHHQAIAEFSVPQVVDSTTVTDLEIAADPVQPFATVLDRLDNPESIDRLHGLAMIDGPNGRELVVNSVEYYDAPGDNSDTTLVIRDPSDLAGSAVGGFFEFEGTAHAAGWMSPIPADLQDALGGTHITGSSSGYPIISRLSVGPTAFVFDPTDIVGSSGTPDFVETTPLLDFSLANKLAEDLSNDNGDNDLWTHLSRAVYGFIAPGTRTYVTLGHSAGHDSGVCYKCTQDGQDNPCGGYCAPDPNDYYTYYWLWDVDDLVAVKEGSMQPHEVRPYDYGKWEIPFATAQLGGASYDAESNRLYVTAQKADREQGTYSNPPVIMVYEIVLR
jgi:hypothetical protein